MSIKIRKPVLFALMGILQSFCARMEPTAPGAVLDPAAPGMVKILAAGKFFMQGCNDSLATLDEKPVMLSAFTYDYWLDTIEVTQRDFYDITGRRPVSDTTRFGFGDNYPVYNVSWFDAVLYCNAKSKRNGLDTVYTYGQVQQTAAGTVYDLAGVLSDYSRNGFRLPTESEWEFAAREASSNLPYEFPTDSNDAKLSAWYASNSAGATHPAGLLRANRLGLHDLAGNVFEWTADWKGQYSVKSITNSIGAPQPNAVYERVIKGGAFDFGYPFLRASRRSATYPTTVSSATEYIGFRCARGSFPGGSFITGGTVAFVPDPVGLQLSDVSGLFGTNSARLVVVNTTGENYRTLCVVDFAGSHPMVKQYLDDTSVYRPTISPDGKYVAFCTRDEGLSGKSSVFIRSLDSLNSPEINLGTDSAWIPRWWVNRQTLDTFLIYTNSAVANSSDLWGRGTTFMQKMSQGKPVGARQTLCTTGSFHDGLSPDNRYLVTGYTQLLVEDLSTGTQRQLFLSPANGKDSTGSTQVCNVSVTPDSAHTDRCLFLDFGCFPNQSSLTGDVYSAHQYVFMSDFTGKVLRWYKYPAQENEWDNPEWSNCPRFAVATTRNSAGQATGVWALDLDGYTYTKVLTGTDLSQPYLWIDPFFCTPHTGIDVDSFGIYHDPIVNALQYTFSNRMHFFWLDRDTIQIAFLGSSHTENAVHPEVMMHGGTVNLAVAGYNMARSIYIARNYILNQCPKIKVIGFDITLGGGGMGYNFDNDPVTFLSIVQSTGGVYDAHHDFWKSGLPADFAATVAHLPYPIVYPPADPFGGAIAPCNGWGGNNPESLNSTVLADDPQCIATIDRLHAFADTLAALNVHLIVYLTPESPAYKLLNVCGRFGPSIDEGKKILQMIQTIETSNPFFHVYDMNLWGNHDYTSDEAWNSDHLCTAGGVKFSRRMDSIITTILKY